jgi:hypothetical protein
VVASRDGSAATGVRYDNADGTTDVLIGDRDLVMAFRGLDQLLPVPSRAII